MGRSVLLLALLFTTSVSMSVAAQEMVFEGPWRTTNRKLDGKMTCVVTKVGVEKWRGRFQGIWNGVAFDHTVDFSGPTSNLRGQATIDGANYTWSGAIDEQGPRRFRGTFGGSRYEGLFELTQSIRSK